MKGADLLISGIYDADLPISGTNFRWELETPVFTQLDNLLGLPGVYSYTHEFPLESTLIFQDRYYLPKEVTRSIVESCPFRQVIQASVFDLSGKLCCMQYSSTIVLYCYSEDINILSHRSITKERRSERGRQYGKSPERREKGKGK